MKIRRENLLIALNVAIREMSESEQKRFGNDFESALVAGLRDVATSVQGGDTIEFYGQEDERPIEFVTSTRSQTYYEVWQVTDGVSKRLGECTEADKQLYVEAGYDYRYRQLNNL